jgi:hypothetical protein
MQWTWEKLLAIFSGIGGGGWINSYITSKINQDRIDVEVTTLEVQARNLEIDGISKMIDKSLEVNAIHAAMLESLTGRLDDLEHKMIVSRAELVEKEGVIARLTTALCECREAEEKL